VKAPPLDVAREAARLRCRDAGVRLVEPGDPLRELVVLAVWLLHAAMRSGWSREVISERVSFTLPGLGVLASVLASVPVIGEALRLLDAGPEPVVLLSPDAWNGDGVRLLGVVGHELRHVGQLRRAEHHAPLVGPVAWCVAYGLTAQARAGTEAPCYGCDAAHSVMLAGVDPGDAVRAARASLANGYELDRAAGDLADDVLASVEASLRAGVDPTGSVVESLDALRRVGWSPT